MTRGANPNKIRSGVRLAVICAGLIYAFAQPAHAREECAESTSAAVKQAQKALESHDTAGERAALVCMVAAVAALDARLAGLSSGSVPFDGRIHIPKGYVFTKPPAEEGD